MAVWVDVYLSFVFLFDMSEECGITEVAFGAGADEESFLFF